MKQELRILKTEDGHMIRIHKGLVILVAYNGGGKTAFLENFNTGRFEISGTNGAAYYFGLTMDGYSARRILKQAGIDSEEKMQLFIKENFPGTIANMLLQRLTYANIFDNKVDEKLAYRRLLFLTALKRFGESQPVIMIDEPELLAHPVIRKEIEIRLQSMIEQMDAAVIVATNSDNVTAEMAVDVRQVVRLDFERGNTRILQLDTDKLQDKLRKFYHQDPYLLKRFSRNDQEDEGLVNVVENEYCSFMGSALGPHLFNIMFANHVIIGEGASEGVLFDYVQNVLHPEWIRRYRVAFVSCLGKSTMPLYFLYMNEMGADVICMYDYDNDRNPVHVAYKNAFQRYQQSHEDSFTAMAMRPDLEGVLQIAPDYRLESIEKPVNVFAHTYAASGSNEQLKRLMEQWERTVRRMDKE